MEMANVDLYIDVTTSNAVVSTSDISVAQLPQFVQGDTINFRVFLIRSVGRLSTPARVTTTGRTLQMALGTRVGNTTTYYTQQFTWEPNDDEANPHWTAQLPMSTAAINSLISAGESAQAWFEVKVIENGLPTTVLSKLVNILAAVIKEGGITVPALPTPLSVEAAIMLFLQREITGPIYLVNETTGLKLKLYATASNPPAFAADPVL